MALSIIFPCFSRFIKISPPIENQASIVAGRRQEHCPDPRGQMETLSNPAGGNNSVVPRAQENARYEINESRPRTASVLKQVWRFVSGKSSSESPVPKTEPKYERDSYTWSTIDLTSPTDEGRYRAPQLSPYPEDRRGRATRLNESRIQSYWNTPFLSESQVPPASNPTSRPFANDPKPEEDLDIEVVTWNPGPCRTVRIVHDDPHQAVQPQAAIVVDPSTEDFSSDSENLVASTHDSSSVLTSDSEDETYGEEEEEDIVAQARRVTRVGRATLIKLPELNRNQNEDVEEGRPPSIDLADCSVERDDTRSPASISLRARKLC
ncbi:unnamed protein product [Fusarium langsethiae]|nr:unnamed protein product [Fusarium langsethiae]GKU10347.1 unnamed protein product [Fusarium langsethiae]